MNSVNVGPATNISSCGRRRPRNFGISSAFIKVTVLGVGLKGAVFIPLGKYDYRNVFVVRCSGKLKGLLWVAWRTLYFLMSQIFLLL